MIDSSNGPGTIRRVRRTAPVSTSRTVSVVGPSTSCRCPRRRATGGPSRPGMRRRASGPAHRTRGVPRRPLAEPEPGPEERRRRVAQADGEEALVPERARPRARRGTRSARRVRAIGGVGLVREVGEADQPPVHPRDGAEEEVVGAVPRPTRRRSQISVRRKDAKTPSATIVSRPGCPYRATKSMAADGGVSRVRAVARPPARPRRPKSAAPASIAHEAELRPPQEGARPRPRRGSARTRTNGTE